MAATSARTLESHWDPKADFSPTTNCAAARPNFNSRVTSDRLREGESLFLPQRFRASTNIGKDRASKFKELDLNVNTSHVLSAELSAGQPRSASY